MEAVRGAICVSIVRPRPRQPLGSWTRPFGVVSRASFPARVPGGRRPSKVRNPPDDHHLLPPTTLASIFHAAGDFPLLNYS